MEKKENGFIRWCRFFWKMCTELAAVVRNDFTAEGRAKFIPYKRYVNVLVGLGFTILASIVTFKGYENQFDVLEWRIALNLPLMYMLGLFLGMLIDLIQKKKEGNKSNPGDPRFTAYGTILGNAAVYTLNVHKYDHYSLWIGLATCALAVLLWIPRNKK